MMQNARLSETVKLACSRQLAEFIERTPGVTFAQLTTADGFEVASQPRSTFVPGKLAAMGSSLHALSEALLAECGQSLSRNVIIESNDGHLALMAVPGAQLALSLLVVSNRSAILGHLLWSAKNCASTLGKLLAY